MIERAEAVRMLDSAKAFVAKIEQWLAISERQSLRAVEM